MSSDDSNEVKTSRRDALKLGLIGFATSLPLAKALAAPEHHDHHSAKSSTKKTYLFFTKEEAQFVEAAVAPIRTLYPKSAPRHEQAFSAISRVRHDSAVLNSQRVSCRWGYRSPPPTSTEQARLTNWYWAPDFLRAFQHHSEFPLCIIQRRPEFLRNFQARLDFFAPASR
jgi:hypothetical protein